MTIESCSICRFWEKIQDNVNGNLGYCRRLSPARASAQLRPVTDKYYFPATQEHQWCGEWESLSGSTTNNFTNSNLGYDVFGNLLIATGSYSAVPGLRVYVGPTDSYSNVPVIVDYAHHQYHEGEGYQYTYPLTSMNNGDVKRFLLTVPANISDTEQPNIILGFDTLSQTKLSLYESPTLSSIGTQISGTYNKNRSSTRQPKMLIYADPAFSNNGTLLDQHTIGDAGTGDNLIELDEWILKKGLTYQILIESNNTPNGVSMRLRWYEDLGI